MCNGDAKKTATIMYSLKMLLMVDAIKFTSHGALFHFNNNTSTLQITYNQNCTTFWLVETTPSVIDSLNMYISCVYIVFISYVKSPYLKCIKRVCLFCRDKSSM